MEQQYFTELYLKAMGIMIICFPMVLIFSALSFLLNRKKLGFILLVILIPFFFDALYTGIAIFHVSPKVYNHDQKILSAPWIHEVKNVRIRNRSIDTLVNTTFSLYGQRETNDFFTSIMEIDFDLKFRKEFEISREVRKTPYPISAKYFADTKTYPFYVKVNTNSFAEITRNDGDFLIRFYTDKEISQSDREDFNKFEKIYVNKRREIGYTNSFKLDVDKLVNEPRRFDRIDTLIYLANPLSHAYMKCIDAIESSDSDTISP